MVNEGYVRAGFAHNWLASLEKVGLADQATIYASDDSAMNLLRGVRPPVVRLDSAGLRNVRVWSEYGSSDFKWATLAKLDLIRQLIESDNTPILFADADLVFLKNPLSEVLKDAGDCPLCFQADNRMSVEHPATLICTGFFLIQPDRWNGWARLFDLSREDVAQFNHDQELMQDRVVRLEESPFKLLPQTLFPNGSCLEKGGGVPKQAYIVHFNHMMSHEKLIQMRRHRFWYVNRGLKAYLGALGVAGKHSLNRKRVALGRFRRKYLF